MRGQRHLAGAERVDRQGRHAELAQAASCLRAPPGPPAARWRPPSPSGSGPIAACTCVAPSVPSSEALAGASLPFGVVPQIASSASFAGASAGRAIGERLRGVARRELAQQCRRGIELRRIDLGRQMRGAGVERALRLDRRAAEVFRPQRRQCEMPPVPGDAEMQAAGGEAAAAGLGNAHRLRVEAKGRGRARRAEPRHVATSGRLGMSRLFAVRVGGQLPPRARLRPARAARGAGDAGAAGVQTSAAWRRARHQPPRCRLRPRRHRQGASDGFSGKPASIAASHFVVREKLTGTQGGLAVEPLRAELCRRSADGRRPARRRQERSAAARRRPTSRWAARSASVSPAQVAVSTLTSTTAGSGGVAAVSARRRVASGGSCGGGALVSACGLSGSAASRSRSSVCAARSRSICGVGAEVGGARGGQRQPSVGAAEAQLAAVERGMLRVGPSAGRTRSRRRAHPRSRRACR